MGFVEKELERMSNMMEKFQENLQNINASMVEYNALLEHHIKRTEAAEAVQSAHSTRISDLERLEVEKQAVRKFKKQQRDKWLMWIGIIATVVGILAGLKTL